MSSSGKAPSSLSVVKALYFIVCVCACVCEGVIFVSKIH